MSRLMGTYEGCAMKKFLLGFAFGLLALPLAIIIVARLGLLPINANTSPSGLETSFAHMALDASAARHAPYLSDPIAPTEENLMAGLILFKSDCAAATAPRIPCQRKRNQSNPLSQRPSVCTAPASAKPQDYSSCFWIVKGGVRYSGMFAWAGQFAPDASGKDVSDEKIWSAVTFLTHLDSLPPAVNAEWHKKSGN